MTDPTIAARVTRRGDLAGEMHTLQTRLNDVHTALASRDDVICQFNSVSPGHNPAALPAGDEPQMASISRAVVDTLRRALCPLGQRISRRSS